MKQVILIRADLKMSKGKIASQACHACLGAVEKSSSSDIRKWKTGGQKKVVLKVNGLSELDAIIKKARKEEIKLCIIADAGLTELEPGTVTAAALGPASEKKLDQVTGHLKLL
ncbi:MAG: peptidyl-tRNA hydrolase Pth2 [Candidatus Aenigmarchaeota archaeon]|nr:peptidyl-tRNA hydrolase Pth2 [Candidatus Aenigmarchaeota archaeon]